MSSDGSPDDIPRDTVQRNFLGVTQAAPVPAVQSREIRECSHCPFRSDILPALEATNMTHTGSAFGARNMVYLPTPVQREGHHTASCRLTDSDDTGNN